MSEDKKNESVEDGPARTSDDPQEAAEKVAEAGHDTSGGDADSAATGDGPSGGAAESSGSGDADSAATGAGGSGGAPSTGGGTSGGGATGAGGSGGA